MRSFVLLLSYRVTDVDGGFTFRDMIASSDKQQQQSSSVFFFSFLIKNVSLGKKEKKLCKWFDRSSTTTKNRFWSINWKKADDGEKNRFRTNVTFLWQFDFVSHQLLFRQFRKGSVLVSVAAVALNRWLRTEFSFHQRHRENLLLTSTQLVILRKNLSK